MKICSVLFVLMVLLSAGGCGNDLNATFINQEDPPAHDHILRLEEAAFWQDPALGGAAWALPKVTTTVSGAAYQANLYWQPIGLEGNGIYRVRLTCSSPAPKSFSAELKHDNRTQTAYASQIMYCDGEEKVFDFSPGTSDATAYFVLNFGANAGEYNLSNVSFQRIDASVAGSLRLADAVFWQDPALGGASWVIPRVAVTKAGLPYQVNLSWRPVDLVAGRTYRIRLVCSSPASKYYTAELKHDGPTDYTIYFSQTLYCDGEEKIFDFVPSLNDGAAQFALNFGANAGEYNLSNISIQKL